MPKASTAKVLTEKYVESIRPPTTGRFDEFDAKVPGLHLRVSFTGSKTWNLLYRMPGSSKLIRVKLGSYSEMGVKDARDAANAVLAQAREGTDAAARNRAKKSAPTIEWLAATFYRDYVEANKRRSARRYESVLRRYVVERWRDRKAADIKRKEVEDLLREIAANHPIQANRTLAVIRKMYNWAMDNEYLAANPCRGVKPLGEEQECTRYLRASDLKAIWPEIEAQREPFRSAIKLHLLTGQRTGEICRMRWDEVDLIAGVWTIPSNRVKNKRHHRLPLTPVVKAILTKRKATTVGSDWVFPSPSNPLPPIVDPPTKSITAVREPVERIRKSTGIYFTPHDFRRTVATHLADLDVDIAHISRLLNHVKGGVTEKHYIQATFDKQKRAALLKWETWLRSALELSTLDPDVEPGPHD
jgi:integrase